MRAIRRYLIAVLIGLVVGVSLEICVCLGCCLIHAHTLALLERGVTEYCDKYMRAADYNHGLCLFFQVFVLGWFSNGPTHGGLIPGSILAALLQSMMRDA